MSQKVLVVEDETNIRNFIAINLKRNDFEVIEAASGEQGLELAEKQMVDVAVLDVLLPGIDGLQVCTKLRERLPDIAIIMLTAKSQDMDRVMGLELGADDYMTKPFNPLELVARIRAILRRINKVKVEDRQDLIIIRDIKLDMLAQRVYKGDVEIELTNREFSLIEVFMKNPGRAFKRDELLNLAWGEDFFGDVKTVDVHVRRLREKLEEDSKRPQNIETVWGYGYRLKENVKK